MEWGWRELKLPLESSPGFQVPSPTVTYYLNTEKGALKLQRSGFLQLSEKRN
jgi:hypothetical protein